MTRRRRRERGPPGGSRETGSGQERRGSFRHRASEDGSFGQPAKRREHRESTTEHRNRGGRRHHRRLRDRIGGARAADGEQEHRPDGRRQGRPVLRLHAVRGAGGGQGGRLQPAGAGPRQVRRDAPEPAAGCGRVRKPAALLVAPNDVKASAPPLKRIQKAGTKVVLVDTIVTDKSIGVSRIATDNELGGEKAAQALAQLGVKGKVLVISTDPGVSSVDARIAGFNKKAAALGMTLVEQGPVLAQRGRPRPRRSSRRRSPRTLTSQGVFATNLFSAQGVATGVTPGRQVGHGQGRRLRRRARTRSSSSRRARCRRSSPRSRTTSASRASSRRSPR